jgi:hypothetical protein
LQDVATARNRLPELKNRYRVLIVLGDIERRIGSADRACRDYNEAMTLVSQSIDSDSARYLKKFLAACRAN